MMIGSAFVPGTIVSIALVRSSQFATVPGAFEVAPSFLFGAFDGLGLMASSGYGFFIGALEGGLLTLTYPAVRYMFPKKYPFGTQTYHMVPIIYLLANMLYGRYN